MSRHAPAEIDARTALVGRMADQITRHVLDLRITNLDAAAEAAAYRILADREIAAGLRARLVLAAIATMHEPRTWRGSTAVTVCARCNEAWPCETRALLDGALTPARSDHDPAGPGGPNSPGVRQEGDALPHPGFHPDTTRTHEMPLVTTGTDPR